MSMSRRGAVLQAALSDSLLRIGWWPATQLKPKTVATFEVLQHFHLLNKQGKVTGYSFYQALEYQTDNTGLNLPSVSSLALPSMFSQLKWNEGPPRYLHVDGPRMA
jgi:hypothetical protein